ncbi:very long-chain acyl-CoA synthetase-like [Anneissia japonica]|uniref:very long-chain acyl-CoA synthetase-like n=1 Tax=Anneissia japonica TaxID=1529436 RepID=UPI0014259DB7|nr:very long-chain acyl-CoA synthetase-like [Anneissia japonica]
MANSKRTGLYLGLGGTAAFGLYLHRKYRDALVNDVRMIRFGYRALQFRGALEREDKTIVDVFLQSLVNNPNKPMILFEDSVYTYADVEKESNKIGNYLRSTGILQQKDTVALILPNEPAYIFSFLGLQKLGINCALINYNLRGRALLNCIKIGKAKAILCSGADEHIKAVMEILPELEQSGICVWVLGTGEKLPPGMTGLLDHLQRASDAPVPFECRDKITHTDNAGYIYTSGTTGYPKACKVSHGRFILTSFILDIYGLNSDDVVYTPLPLYHSAGFGLGLLNIIRVGSTIALSRKFSASQFWDDVRRYRCTVIQYIGEICRYLLAQPRRHDDGKYAHKLRLAIGNGLRPDIWEEFQSRFNIQHIGEIWGATEGNTMFLNIDGKIGTVGRYTPLMKLLTGSIQILRYDVDGVEPIRDKNGRCIPVCPGEMGLMVTQIIPKKSEFEGYTGEAATQKKIIRNVFKDGDMYFNSGDLIKIDKEGYIYFMDRLGDTFRWKGENVATTEVADVLDEFPGIVEANVYGVKVPGQDGRAGMAALTLHDNVDVLDFKKLYAHVTSKLPSYACPKFLRIMTNMEITGTFKHKKGELVKDGFDPNKVFDPMYRIDTASKSYVPLNKSNYSTSQQLSSKL